MTIDMYNCQSKFLDEEMQHSTNTPLAFKAVYIKDSTITSGSMSKSAISGNPQSSIKGR